MKKQSFITGAAIMSVASILCKIMSAIFKIPLDRFFLHEGGIAIYQSVYSIYNVFLSVCITGIPLALSGLVSKSDEKESADLFKSTSVSVTFLCFLASLALFIFAKPISIFLSGGGSPLAFFSLRAISPALLFLGITSSARGYFQGNSNMFPSAISQLFESIVKVGFGLFLCWLFIDNGIKYGAMGAILGVSLSAGVSCLILYLFYRKDKKAKGHFSIKKALLVFSLSLPVTLGTFSYTATLLIDSFTVTNILSLVGVSEDARIQMFGYLTRANTVYNLPAAIISAITASIVPIVALHASKKESALLGENLAGAIKTIFYVASPCAFGLMFFSSEIFMLLFLNGSASFLLALTGALVLILPYIQTTTAILQVTGYVWQPIWVGIGSLLLKVLLNFVFISKFGIYGALISTVISFLPYLVFNTILIKRLSPAGFKFGEIAKILLCGFLCCLLSRIVYSLTGGFKMFIVSVCLAAVLYVIFLFLSGSIKYSDIKAFLKKEGEIK